MLYITYIDPESKCRMKCTDNLTNEGIKEQMQNLKELIIKQEEYGKVKMNFQESPWLLAWFMGAELSIGHQDQQDSTERKEKISENELVSNFQYALDKCLPKIFQTMWDNHPRLQCFDIVDKLSTKHQKEDMPQKQPQPKKRKIDKKEKAKKTTKKHKKSKVSGNESDSQSEFLSEDLAEDKSKTSKKKQIHKNIGQRNFYKFPGNSKLLYTRAPKEQLDKTFKNTMSQQAERHGAKIRFGVEIRKDQRRTCVVLSKKEYEVWLEKIKTPIKGRMKTPPRDTSVEMSAVHSDFLSRDFFWHPDKTKVYTRAAEGQSMKQFRLNMREQAIEAQVDGTLRFGTEIRKKVETNCLILKKTAYDQWLRNRGSVPKKHPPRQHPTDLITVKRNRYLDLLLPDSSKENRLPGLLANLQFFQVPNCPKYVYVREEKKPASFKQSLLQNAKNAKIAITFYFGVEIRKFQEQKKKSFCALITVDELKSWLKSNHLNVEQHPLLFPPEGTYIKLSGANLAYLTESPSTLPVDLEGLLHKDAAVKKVLTIAMRKFFKIPGTDLVYTRAAKGQKLRLCRNALLAQAKSVGAVVDFRSGEETRRGETRVCVVMSLKELQEWLVKYEVGPDGNLPLPMSQESSFLLHECTSSIGKESIEPMEVDSKAKDPDTEPETMDFAPTVTQPVSDIHPTSITQLMPAPQQEPAVQILTNQYPESQVTLITEQLSDFNAVISKFSERIFFELNENDGYLYTMPVNGETIDDLRASMEKFLAQIYNKLQIIVPIDLAIQIPYPHVRICKENLRTLEKAGIRNLSVSQFLANTELSVMPQEDSVKSRFAARVVRECPGMPGYLAVEPLSGEDMNSLNNDIRAIYGALRGKLDAVLFSLDCTHLAIRKEDFSMLEIGGYYNKFVSQLLAQTVVPVAQQENLVLTQEQGRPKISQQPSQISLPQPQLAQFVTTVTIPKPLPYPPLPEATMSAQVTEQIEQSQPVQLTTVSGRQTFFGSSNHIKQNISRQPLLAKFLS